MGSDGTKQNGMGRDGMGRDGSGWAGMGWDMLGYVDGAGHIHITARYGGDKTGGDCVRTGGGQDGIG